MSGARFGFTAFGGDPLGEALPPVAIVARTSGATMPTPLRDVPSQKKTRER